MKLDVMQAPDCPHLYKGRCLEAIRLLGNEILVTPPVCNVSCRDKWGGPYRGREINDDQRGRWAAAMLKYQWGPLAAKVWGRYSKPFRVEVPDVLPRVREALAPVLRRKDVVGWGLTGSVLAGPTVPRKDIDVLIVVKSVRGWYKRPAKLPREVDGVRLDVFVGESFVNYFMVLDAETLTLYKSGYYNVVGLDPRVSAVRQVDSPIYAAFRVHQALGVTPSASSAASAGDETTGWAAVAGTWRMATDYAAAALSRGLVATARGGTAGRRAEAARVSLRVLSCHGDAPAGVRACPARAYDATQKFHYCNDCGCGAREEARLDSVGSGPDEPTFTEGDYTKLQYPTLKCPRRRPGFSNEYRPTEDVGGDRLVRLLNLAYPDLT